jgi:hypothetical protein
MNITGKDRKDYAPPSHFPSAFVVSFQAKSTRRVGRQCQSSRLSGLSVSSSSLTVPFKHRHVSSPGYVSTHSWKDGQGVVIQGQEHVAV